MGPPSSTQCITVLSAHVLEKHDQGLSPCGRHRERRKAGAVLRRRTVTSAPPGCPRWRGCPRPHPTPQNRRSSCRNSQEPALHPGLLRLCRPALPLEASSFLVLVLVYGSF